jgi:hypothetical protein
MEFYFKKHLKAKGKEEFESFRRIIDRKRSGVRNEDNLKYISVEESE